MDSLFYRGLLVVLGSALVACDRESEVEQRDADSGAPAGGAAPASDAAMSGTGGGMAAGGGGNQPDVLCEGGPDCSISDASADAETGTEQCPSLDGPDAGALTLRVCSASVLQRVAWRHDVAEDGGPICGPTPLPEGCPLDWGCDAFDAARTAAAQCDAGASVRGQRTGRGWGFLIIQQLRGASTDRGYYDPGTGELVGYWTQDDVGYENCSGTIPRNSSDEQAPITDIEPLCAADGGVLFTDGGDGG